MVDKKRKLNIIQIKKEGSAQLTGGAPGLQIYQGHFKTNHSKRSHNNHISSF